MSKRFLTWGLAVLLVVAFSGVALATDQPSGNREDAINVFDHLTAKAAPLNLASEGVTALDQRTVGNVSQPQTPDAGCQTLYNGCLDPYYVWSVPGATNSREAMAEGLLPDPGFSATPCTVMYTYVLVYDWINAAIKDSVRVQICADDGAGLPGVSLGTVWMSVAEAQASIDAFDFAVQDWTGMNLVIPAGEKFHVVVDVPDGIHGTSGVLLLSDGGTDDAANCPEGAANTSGSVFYSGVGFWESHAAHFAGFQFGTFIAADVCCEPVPPDCFTLTNSCLDPYYVWSVPGTTNSREAMAEGFDLDPTATRECTLKTAYVVVYDWINVAIQDDVHVTVHADDGSGLPGAALATEIIPAAVVDANLFAFIPVDFSAYNLTAPPGGRLHVAVTVPAGVHGTSGVLLLSDGGTDDAANCPAGAANTKGSVFYSGVGFWESHAAHFAGFQFGTFIAVDICCPPLLFALCTPGVDADWSVSGNNDGRTHYTPASMSSLCGLNQLWTATAGGAIGANSPVISGNYVVVSAFNKLECYDKATGALNWAFGGFPWIGDDLRCVPTVDATGTAVYVGGAAFKSFQKIDLATGAVIWSRNSGGVDVPLNASPGLTRFAPAVEMGGAVYTMDEAGWVYGLDAATGADMPGYPVLLPDAVTGSTPWNALSANVATGKLYVGTGSAIYTDGLIYQIDAATGAIDWSLEDPTQIFTGDAVLYPTEGYPGGFAIEDGILYYHSLVREAGFGHYPNTAGAGAIDLAVEDGTGIGILWVCPSNLGAPGVSGPMFSQPALGPGMVYLNMRGYFVGDPHGIRALDKSLGTIIWSRVEYGVGATIGGAATADIRAYWPLSVFCQPDQTPYVFVGDLSNRWRLLNGNTGAQVWERSFGGDVLTTAIADDYAVVCARYGSSTAGTITAFAVGADRPRMQIDSNFVVRVASPGDGATAGDIVDALQNTGCLTLNASYVATNPVAVRISSVDPNLRANAVRIADQTAGYDNFVAALSDKEIAILTSKLDENEVVDNVRSFSNNASAAVDPLFLTVNTGATAIAPGGTQTLNVTWDETGLMNNTLYTNFIEITSDDPDYFPDDNGSFGLPSIQFQLFIGCPDASGTMTMGYGDEWVSNFGGVADQGNGPGFDINGHAWMYDGGWVAAAVDNDHWAMEGVSVGAYPRRAGEWGPTLPCGINIGSGSYSNPLGGSDAVDTVSFNTIDLASANGYFPVGDRQMYGVILSAQYVTSHDPAFGEFSLTKITVTNEADGQGPLNDFYFGEAIDWDIAAGTDNHTYFYSDGYAVSNQGPGGKGAAQYACGHFRLDDDIVGTASMGSGGAPTFHMGDCFGDQDGDYHCYDIMSDPYNYINNIRPGDQVQNTDVGIYTSLFTTTGLAEGSSETFYYMTYQLDNGVMGLPWADDASYDAALAEVKCRAKAFAGLGAGDVNCDGIVDLADVVLLGNIVDGLYDPAGTGGMYGADCNGDNSITGADYDLLYDVVAGIQPASALVNVWRF